MEATHIPGLDNEEPEFRSEDDIPADDTGTAERDGAREGRLASDSPHAPERPRENPRE
jgi:hypothetical protein